MKTIAGIYDGNKIIPSEKISTKKKYRVLITFVEEVDNDDALRKFASNSEAFGFWENSDEDLYQDYLKK